MSINLIDYRVKDTKLQQDLLDTIFDNINENMNLRNAKKIIDATTFPIKFDYRKSNDVLKLKLLVHCCLVEIDKLVRNFLSNRTDNPFVVLFENFTNYAKSKVIRLKNQNSDLTNINMKLKQKISVLNELCESVEHIMNTQLNARDSKLTS